MDVIQVLHCLHQRGRGIGGSGRETERVNAAGTVGRRRRVLAVALCGELRGLRGLCSPSPK